MDININITLKNIDIKFSEKEEYDTQKENEEYLKELKEKLWMIDLEPF